MSRVVALRITMAGLLLLPCSLLLLRHLALGGSSRSADDEPPLAPAVQLSRETKPTIVKPSENWMDESSRLDPSAPVVPAPGWRPRRRPMSPTCHRHCRQRTSALLSGVKRILFARDASSAASAQAARFLVSSRDGQRPPPDARAENRLRRSDRRRPGCADRSDAAISRARRLVPPRTPMRKRSDSRSLSAAGNPCSRVLGPHRAKRDRLGRDAHPVSPTADRWIGPDPAVRRQARPALSAGGSHAVAGPRPRPRMALRKGDSRPERGRSPRKLLPGNQGRSPSVFIDRLSR